MVRPSFHENTSCQILFLRLDTQEKKKAITPSRGTRSGDSGLLVARKFFRYMDSATRSIEDVYSYDDEPLDCFCTRQSAPIGRSVDEAFTYQ